MQESQNQRHRILSGEKSLHRPPHQSPDVQCGDIFLPTVKFDLIPLSKYHWTGHAGVIWPSCSAQTGTHNPAGPGSF